MILRESIMKSIKSLVFGISTVLLLSTSVAFAAAPACSGNKKIDQSTLKRLKSVEKSAKEALKRVEKKIKDSGVTAVNRTIKQLEKLVIKTEREKENKLYAKERKQDQYQNLYAKLHAKEAALAQFVGLDCTSKAIGGLFDNGPSGEDIIKRCIRDAQVAAAQMIAIGRKKKVLLKQEDGDMDRFDQQVAQIDKKYQRILGQLAAAQDKLVNAEKIEDALQVERDDKELSFFNAQDDTAEFAQTCL